MPQDDLDTLVQTALSEAEKLRRLVTLGEWDTTGPEHDERERIVPPPPDPSHPCWRDGWWEHAIQRAAHPKRVGGAIRAFAIVPHTCDMLPEEFAPLVRNMAETPGAGNAFHFVIGRTPADGVVQCVPITRNANHAGGPGHGLFVDAAGKQYHPNLVAVGIEFHCAGGVRLVGGQWRLVEDGKAHGAPLPAADVTPDPQRPGRGWHNLTDYQRERYTALRADLEAVLAPMPAGLHAVSVVEPAPSWGTFPVGRVAGHVSLDAARRSDPWPPAVAWLRGIESQRSR